MSNIGFYHKHILLMIYFQSSSMTAVFFKEVKGVLWSVIAFALKSVIDQIISLFHCCFLSNTEKCTHTHTHFHTVIDLV